jgi:hypothetical protein
MFLVISFSSVGVLYTLLYPPSKVVTVSKNETKAPPPTTTCANNFKKHCSAKVPFRTEKKKKTFEPMNEKKWKKLFFYIQQTSTEQHNCERVLMEVDETFSML